MEPFKGIKIEILCEGRPLTLYGDPDRDQNEVDNHAKIYYVEAVAGARFVPRVTLDSSYSLSGLRKHDRVLVSISPDGAYKNGTSHSKGSIKKLRRQGREATVEFKDHVLYDPASGEWTRGHLSFSALAVREDDGARPDQASLQSVDRLGCIAISVSHQNGDSFEPSQVPNSAEILEPNKQVSEKLIKGKSITNAISLTDTISTCDPKHIVRPYISGRGEFRQCFNILYRSKGTLQSLGCISRTPTPEPDWREEAHALRARVAELERDGKLDVKAETSRSQACKAFKHELDEEGEGFLPPPVRRRVETIDLTDD